MLVNIINSIAQNEQDVSTRFSIKSPYKNTTLLPVSEEPVLQSSEDSIDIVHAFLLNVLSRRGMMISIPNSWISLKIVPALMIKNAKPDGIPDIPIRVDSPFVILGNVDVLRFITPLTWCLGIGSDFSREQIFSEQRAENVQSTKQSNIDALPENMQHSAFMVMNTQSNTNDFRFNFCNALLMNVIHGKRVFGESSPKFISESSIFQDKLRALVRSENVDPQNIDNLVDGFIDHICQSLGYEISKKTVCQEILFKYLTLFKNAQLLLLSCMHEQLQCLRILISMISAIMRNKEDLIDIGCNRLFQIKQTT